MEYFKKSHNNNRIFIILSFMIFVLSGCTGMSPQTKELLISPERELVNYALSSYGATAESPDNNPDHPPSEVIDGDTSSLDWDSGGGWEGSLSHLRSDELLKRSYIQINLPGKKQVKKIVVYTLDSPKYPAKDYGLKTYTLEYWHGTGWRKIEFFGESKDKRFTIKDNKSGKIVHIVKGDLITEKIRLVPYSSNDFQKEYNLTAFGGKPIYEVSGSSKVIEIEVWCYAEEDGAKVEFQNNLMPVGKSQPSPDEQAIRQVLFDYEQGYDNENLEQVMSIFAEDFMTLDGKSKADIQERASKFFEDYDNINITIDAPKINIEPSGETAMVETNYTLRCVAKVDGNMYERSGALIFNFKKDENSAWKIVSAK
ncbi:MAG: YybH family protein [bacterium]